MQIRCDLDSKTTQQLLTIATHTETFDAERAGRAQAQTARTRRHHFEICARQATAETHALEHGIQPRQVDTAGRKRRQFTFRIAELEAVTQAEMKRPQAVELHELGALEAADFELRLFHRQPCGVHCHDAFECGTGAVRQGVVLDAFCGERHCRQGVIVQCSRSAITPAAHAILAVLAGSLDAEFGELGRADQDAHIVQCIA